MIEDEVGGPVGLSLHQKLTKSKTVIVIVIAIAVAILVAVLR